MLTTGADLTLTIDKPAAGGWMLGRHDGRVVLVRGAIPGERVIARVTRVGKGVAYADTVDVLDASPDRVPGAVDWRCGGNLLAHVSLERQVRLKGEIIDDAFRRIGRLPLPAPPVVVASPADGYRMRARLHVVGSRLGFYREGTHELCDAGITGQLSSGALAWMAAASARLEQDGLTGLRAVELAEDLRGEQRACHLVLAPGEDPARYAALADTLTGLSAESVEDGFVTLAGVPAISDTIAPVEGAEVRVTLTRDVRAFFQGNRFLLEPFVRHVVQRVPTQAAVLDLYAGVGLFGLSLAAAGRTPVQLVEGDRISGEGLAANAAAFAGVTVHRASVEAFLDSSRRRTGDETVVIDPPRTGLSREAATRLAARRAGRLVYVSCDVATLARDARVLVDAGYTLDEVTGFDLFPNTAHVESVARFTRA